jgi:integrase
VKLNSYLKLNRHGTYCLRLQRNGFDRSISLRTKDFAVASAQAYVFGAKIAAMTKGPISAFELDVDILSGRVSLKTSDDPSDRAAGGAAQLRAIEAILAHHSLHQPVATPPVAPAIPISSLKKMSLKDAYLDYEPVLMGTNTDPQKKMSRVNEEKPKTRKTRLGEAKVLNLLIDTLGADFDVSLIDDNLIIDEYITLRLEADPPKKRATVKRELSAIRTFVKWCCLPNQGYCIHQINIPFKAENESYEAFSQNDLERIFWNLPAAAVEPFKFWIPVLGLFTGARIGEIAGMRVGPEDVFKESGINAYKIPGTKTASSERSLPIAIEIIELGFLDYVKARRNAGCEMLFDIPHNSQNGWGAKPSKFFTKYKKSVGIEAGDKVFHSFRHLIVKRIDALHGVSPVAANNYTGHSIGSSAGAGTREKVYSKQLPIHILNEEITSKIKWSTSIDEEFLSKTENPSFNGFNLNLPALKICADKLLEIEIITSSVRNDKKK